MASIALISFPGSHGLKELQEAYEAFEDVSTQVIWHQQERIPEVDLVVLPGGCSFGDYLRPGALALGSPIVAGIRMAARQGVRILGIGNGFQILCEMGLLPGILLRNLDYDLINRDTYVRVENPDVSWASGLDSKKAYKLPLSCTHARYYADSRVIRDIEREDRVLFRFTDQFAEYSQTTPAEAGSFNGIAGVLNAEGTVCGMMMHPERIITEPYSRAFLGLAI